MAAMLQWNKWQADRQIYKVLCTHLLRSAIDHLVTCALPHHSLYNQASNSPNKYSLSLRLHSLLVKSHIEHVHQIRTIFYTKFMLDCKFHILSSIRHRYSISKCTLEICGVPCCLIKRHSQLQQANDNKLLTQHLLTVKETCCDMKQTHCTGGRCRKNK